MTMDLSFLGQSAIGVIMVVLFLHYITNKDKSNDVRDRLFADQLGENTKAMRKVADATVKQAKEAKERNGHLAELAVENNRNNTESNKHIFEALSHIKGQNVENQIVNHQEVKEKQ